MVGVLSPTQRDLTLAMVYGQCTDYDSAERGGGRRCQWQASVTNFHRAGENAGSLSLFPSLSAYLSASFSLLLSASLSVPLSVCASLSLSVPLSISLSLFSLSHCPCV